MKTRVIILSMLLIASKVCFGQKGDTLQITSAYLNTQVLKEGTHRYLVYFKMGKDGTRAQTQFWTRKIERIVYNGIPCIEISQSWEDKDSIMHTVKSISDSKTMKPLHHKTWWKIQRSRTPTKTVTVTTVDFSKGTVEHNGRLLSDTDTLIQEKKIWEGYKSSLNKFHLNWHLDLETFPLLPYKSGRTFVIPYYDPGTASGLEKVSYTVTGSDELVGYDDQKIDCWILVHEEKGNKEMFWISKKTKEVLKLEQEINGTMYRYKIKLGISL